MEVYERVKLLRKEELNLTQEEFSNRIMISRANLGSIEVGRINITDRVIQEICRQFDVNENWLRNGEGDIFITLPPEDEYVRAAAEISKNTDDEIIRQIIIEYWKLNPDGKKQVKEYILNIANALKKGE